ncbi:hypothetical protein ACTID9_08215 [Brevibacillus fluminis]|uniref:hypothetical protein n=1 Tax=Brevibacillus fluminis TaxID=511487 RepID=UPI003F88DAA8
MADWLLEDRNGTLHKASFLPVQKSDIVQMRWTPRLYWERELADKSRMVFKLVDQATSKIQGAISFSDADDHLFIHLLESAPSNRYTTQPPRFFVNVTRLLIAFAGHIANQKGYDGFLALKPKSSLENYYRQQFKAFDLPDRRMGIHGVVSNHWIGVYYK